MVFGRPPPSRKALAAATIGAIFGILILPVPEGTPYSLAGVSLFGVVWFLLSVGLLFTLAMSYHVYVFWAILWVVWKAISGFTRPPIDVTTIVLLVAPPLASLVLLMTSGYLQQAE